MKFFKLIFALLICQAAGGIGSLFTIPAIDSWYADLNKPSFNPPNWLFSPVWITLFVLMGIALYLVLVKDLSQEKVKTALFLFFTQLTFNTLWSVLFFGLKSPLFGFIEIILLIILVLATIFQFVKISKPAALLLVPYLLWIIFAAFLNFSIWQLNF